MRETGRTGVDISDAQARWLSWTTDVLVYTVILNLFVEYVDAIVIDSFTISLLTAVVLKLLLDALTTVEHHVKSWVSQYSKLLGTLSTFVILFLSKFVILEVIDIIFGDHVELGKIYHVIVLVLSLMIGRELMDRAYLALGDGSSAHPEATDA
ncbi:MAG: hypothetical protein OES57_18830 [Acidimicrobiia bacterium]|nr:hypothetical protein [Acidimicrobiia bacterium]